MNESDLLENIRLGWALYTGGIAVAWALHGHSIIKSARDAGSPLAGHPGLVFMALFVAIFCPLTLAERLLIATGLLGGQTK